MASSFLGDLIRAGEISPSKAYLGVDPRKLQRARDRVLAEASVKGEAQTDEDTIQNIMFDSRMDATKVRHFDPETGQFFARIEVQDHYTVTDGEGRFLVHLTKPAKSDKNDGDKGQSVIEEENEERQPVEEESAENNERRERLEEIIGAKNAKPAEVVASMMHDCIRIHGVDSTLQFLCADSTNSNTGWRVGIIA